MFAEGLALFKELTWTRTPYWARYLVWSLSMPDTTEISHRFHQP